MDDSHVPYLVNEERKFLDRRGKKPRCLLLGAGNGHRHPCKNLFKFLYSSHRHKVKSQSLGITDKVKVLLHCLETFS